MGNGSGASEHLRLMHWFRPPDQDEERPIRGYIHVKIQIEQIPVELVGSTLENPMQYRGPPWHVIAHCSLVLEGETP